MAKYQWHKGVISNIIEVSDSVRRFNIDIPEIDRMRFDAGQFIMIDFPVDIKRSFRQYSISSAPNGSSTFEILVALNKEGSCSPYLFQNVEVGDTLPVSSPMGKFVLPENIDRDICFIATGVGIAPFRSMYLDILKKNIPHKEIHVIHGTRFMNTLVYSEELKQLDAEHEEFHYHPVLSKEDLPVWTGKKGYVHQIYQDLFADKKPAYFYLCGWKNMINEAKQNLLDMGYDRKEIKVELFD